MPGIGHLPFALALLLACVEVNAQTLYRCGKTYQDRPCEGPVEGTAVGSAKLRPAPAASPVDAACTRQGNDAIKIMWIKEGGRTEQEQIADARSKGDSADFIHYVYGKRGSATEVRAQVEADCVSDREHGTQSVKPFTTTGTLTGRPDAPSGFSISNSSSAASAQTDGTRQRKDEQCRSLQDKANATKSAQRIGGSASTMELLSKQLQDIENQRRNSGC